MLKKLLILLLLLGGGLFIFLQTSRDCHFEQQSSQFLRQSPELVWQALADIDGWQRWWPGVEKVKLLGPLRVGSKIDLRLKGVPEEHPVALSRFSPMHQLTWQRDAILGSVAETDIVLASQVAGTLLTISNRIVGPQARLAELFNADSFEQYQQLFLKSFELHLRESLPQPVVGEKD